MFDVYVIGNIISLKYRTGRQKVNPKGVDETHFCPIFYTSQVSLYLCTKAGVFLKGLNITEKTILPLQFIDS